EDMIVTNLVTNHWCAFRCKIMQSCLINHETSQLQTCPPDNTPSDAPGFAATQSAHACAASLDSSGILPFLVQTEIRYQSSPGELDEYNELCAHLRNELQPASLFEEALAKDILRALWRLRRCEIVEAGLAPSDTLDSDPAQLAVDRARAQANATLRRSYEALS